MDNQKLVPSRTEGMMRTASPPQGTRYPLGRKPSPFDSRDYYLEDFLKRALFKPKSKVYDFPSAPLDQSVGQPDDKRGHCGGFGIADWGITSPVNDAYTNDDGHRFYYLCKQIDGEPNAEDGTYTRTVGKAIVKLGRAKGYAFAHSLETAKQFVLTQGPLIYGSIWTEGMDDPDKYGFVRPRGAVRGGHLYVVRGYDKVVRVGVYVCQQSWGDFALGGMFYIDERDMPKNFRQGGELLAAVELPR